MLQEELFFITQGNYGISQQARKEFCGCICEQSPVDLSSGDSIPREITFLIFIAIALKLAIEADGSIHNDPYVMQSDIERQKNLEAQGIQFVRFTNEEIICHLDIVIEKINDFIAECKCKNNETLNSK